MEIENLAGVWPNVAINPATGKTYETEHIDTREQLEAYVYDGWLDDYSRGKVFEKKCDELQNEIKYLRKVCQMQADSFAAIENENTELRSRLNRIRELAERLQDA